MSKYKKNVNGPSKEDKAIEQFAEMMISKLESIKQDWKKPWFAEGLLSWPQNFNGRKYNGMNTIILTMVSEEHGYEVPVWCTFDRVASLNGHKNSEGKWVPEVDENGERLPRVGVNKGEKSTPVFIMVKSVVNPETKERIKYEDYSAMSESEQQKYNVYPKIVVYNVFNIAQTNMYEARPELYEKIKNRALGGRRKKEYGEDFVFPAMDSMIAESKWYCPIKPTYGDKAYYSISKDEIIVPEKSQFVNGESFYSNLWHEMAHSTGAESRLNRIISSSFGSEEYGREELVAELTAALVGVEFGLQKNLKKDSCAYIKGWLEQIKKEPSFIKSVLFDVRKAASLIIQAIGEIEMGYEEDRNC